MVPHSNDFGGDLASTWIKNPEGHAEHVTASRKTVLHNDSWQFKGGPKWSLVAGTGIDLSFVTLDIRYLYSVSDWSNLSVSEVNNSGVQLNLGFKIL